ncbi:MAG: hypothetical protein QXK37_03225 [Candidatus Woesearchaeota archaeon]
MRLSSGSASVLGLMHGNQAVKPTTIYCLIGDFCKNSCHFCSQPFNQKIVGRIEWPEIDDNYAIEAINKSSIERVCLQCTSSGLKKARIIAGKLCGKNIRICYNFRSLREVRFIEPYVNKICIPLDTANRNLSYLLKNMNFDKVVNLLCSAAKVFPNKVCTHIIVGLGESEGDVTKLMELLHKNGIGIGLFAFTPLKGTSMESMPRPQIGYYRKIQIRYHRIKGRKASPDAFQTSGCEGCNRPFFNERPSGPIYNYPRPLSEDEYRRCIEEIKSYKK